MKPFRFPLFYPFLFSILFFASTGCDNPFTDNDTADSVTREEVVAILTDWRDRIEPSVSQQYRDEVDAYAAGFPLDAPDGTEPVSISATGTSSTSIQPQINRRDWAYAARGIGYTLFGAVGQGQSALIDAGFWCFLEAALLQPDEPEHLGNVAFHLNARGEYEDAMTLLLYARSLDPANISTRNNLAFSYNRRGDHEAAISEALYAVSLRPDQTAYLERLRDYYNDAGYTEQAQAIQVALDGIGDFPLPPLVPSEPKLSPAGEKVREKIKALSSQMYEEGDRIYKEHQPEIDAVMTAFGNAYAPIVQEMFADCPQRVTMTGGDLYAVCVNCFIPGGQNAYGAFQTFYASMLPIISSMENQCFAVLADLTFQADRAVQQAMIPEREKEILYAEVHRKLFLEHSSIILSLRKQANRSRIEVEQQFNAAMAEGCGDAPVGDIPHVEEESISCQFMPFMCKSWTFYFLVGNFQWNPDGTMQLSIGELASLKLEYNLDTGHAGFGFGLGVSAGPLNAEASLMFRSKTGVEASIDVKASPANIPLMLPGSEEPKFWERKLGEFENGPYKAGK